MNQPVMGTCWANEIVIVFPSSNLFLATSEYCSDAKGGIFSI